MAAKDAAKIKDKKTIDHFLNGIAYCLTIVIFCMIFEMDWLEVIIFALSCFCNRQLFFDIPLNLMRKIKWNYIPAKPESFVDKIELKFGFTPGTIEVIYLMIWVATILSNLLIESL
jgi:hypothetical protein